jgi:hypothetical protein
MILIPFQVDPNWYQRYWLDEHPRQRASAAASADRDRLALWPLLLVVAIAVFIVWASDVSSTPDEHMASRNLQAEIAP